jgi:uncharacterized RDD family membrane protein YckC
MKNTEYAGFWIRAGASVIDTILIMVILGPLLTLIYGKNYWYSESLTHGGPDIFISYILPAIAVVVFWIFKSATPGKMVTKLTIVDARTGGKPTTGQFIGRYFGYFVSIIPLFLGIIWVGIDKRKQGWHDKLAGTVVIRKNGAEEVVFDEQV